MRCRPYSHQKKFQYKTKMVFIQKFIDQKLNPNAKRPDAEQEIHKPREKQKLALEWRKFKTANTIFVKNEMETYWPKNCKYTIFFFLLAGFISTCLFAQNEMETEKNVLPSSAYEYEAFFFWFMCTVFRPAFFDWNSTNGVFDVPWSSR